MTRRTIEGVWQDPALPRVFSGRSEAAIDAETFAHLAGALGASGKARVFIGYPDEGEFPPDLVLVEVHTTTDVTYEQVLNAARLVPDGHVLLQTLRPVPIGRNSLERNYERR